MYENQNYINRLLETANDAKLIEDVLKTPIDAQIETLSREAFENEVLMFLDNYEKSKKIDEQAEFRLICALRKASLYDKFWSIWSAKFDKFVETRDKN